MQCGSCWTPSNNTLFVYVGVGYSTLHNGTPILRQALLSLNGASIQLINPPPRPPRRGRIHGDVARRLRNRAEQEPA